MLSVRTPSSLFGATMQGIQPKFYAMGLMYALNARVTFQQKWVGDNDRTVSGRVSPVSVQNVDYSKGPVFAMSNRPSQKTQLQTALEVEVETQTYVQVSYFRHCRMLAHPSQSSARNDYDKAFDRPGVNRVSDGYSSFHCSIYFELQLILRQGVYEVDKDKKESESLNDQPQLRFNSQARLTTPEGQ